MGNCISMYQKQFINELSIDCRDVMINSEVGDHLRILSNCGSKVRGIFESYEDGGIFIIINSKSKVLVRGENVVDLENIK